MTLKPKRALIVFAHSRGATVLPFLKSLVCALAAGLLAPAAAAAQDVPDGFLSRVTLEFPLVTQHLAAGHSLDDHNWGLVVDVALSPRLSLVGGEFKNSYRKDTALLGARYSFFRFTPGSLALDFGAVAGADLNGGYRDHSAVDPLMAAASIKITGNGFAQNQFLNRTGIVFTIIPGEVTAINLALAVGL